MLTNVGMMDEVDYIFNDSVLYSGDRQKLIMCSREVNGIVVIPDSVKYISDYAFYWCRNIEEIVLPDTIEHIGRYAFLGCRNLKKIEMSGANIKYIDSSNFISDKTAELLGKIYMLTMGLCITQTRQSL